MINFFLRVLVLVAGIALTLALAIVVGGEIANLFPGTTLDWHTGVFTYRSGDDYALIVGAVASVIVTVAGFTATTVAFERIDALQYR